MNISVKAQETAARRIRTARYVREAATFLRQALRATVLDEDEIEGGALNRWNAALDSHLNIKQGIIDKMRSELLFAAAQETDADALPVRIYEVFEERFGNDDEMTAL